MSTLITTSQPPSGRGKQFNITSPLLTHHTITNMADALTPEEQTKLKQAWIHLLRLSNVPGLESTPPLTPPFPNLTSHLEHTYLNGTPATSFRTALWSALLFEHPDTLVLRFLRARKWDVAKSIEMLVSAVTWRTERDIPSTILLRGENISQKSADDDAFLSQYRSGKSFVRGKSRDGYPVYIIRACLHDPGAQSAAVMERYILHNIETLRLVARPPADRCCLFFDMTGFGVRNMDFAIVRFLIGVFEARYPETLGVAVIHNAPFVFWGIWNIIKSWIDPVIASKIHFTRKPADLLQFISEENLQTKFGGKDDWEYAYVEPQPGENARLGEVEKRAEIEKEREELLREFERETVEWAVSGKDGAKRSEVAARLGENYWRLDPYIRARTLLHRTGIVPDV